MLREFLEVPWVVAAVHGVLRLGAAVCPEQGWNAAQQRETGRPCLKGLLRSSCARYRVKVQRFASLLLVRNGERGVGRGAVETAFCAVAGADAEDGRRSAHGLVPQYGRTEQGAAGGQQPRSVLGEGRRSRAPKPGSGWEKEMPRAHFPTPRGRWGIFLRPF